MSPARAAPVSSRKQDARARARANGGTRASLGALLSLGGGVSGASAPVAEEMRWRDAEETSSEGRGESPSASASASLGFGARLPPVSREDLEKSPSWQLQRRLESLEARAAALLLDEEEEAARR